MSLLHRSCSLLTAVALLCSQMVGSGQVSAAAKESGAVLGSQAPKVAASHPTGFRDVAPYLNADGAVLSFYDTRDIVAAAEGILSTITKAMLQQANEDEGAQAAAKILRVLYENSGVKSLAAIGSSSVPRGGQVYYNRKYIARTAGDTNPGFLWNSFTEKTAPLAGLDLLPVTTGWATFGNVDFAYLDSFISKIASVAGSANGIEQFRKRLEKSGVKWEEILSSLNNEMGVVLLMDPKKTIRVPAGPMALEFPHPSGGIILRAKSNYIYQRILELGGPDAPKEEEIQGVRMLSKPVPNPVVPDFAPTIAVVDQYLVIGSSRDFPLQLAATLRGKTPGLRMSEEFKQLSRDVPLEGSAFSFASSRFCDSLHQLFNQLIAAAPADGQPEELKQMSKIVVAGILPAPSFAVYQRVGADWLITSNGPQETPMGAAASAGTVAMLSAIAVPSFLRARNRAQAAQVLAGARMLDVAVDQYSIENNIRSGAQVAFKDLRPYLGADSPLALSGGNDIFGRLYILKPVDEGVRIHPETIQQFEKSGVTRDFFMPYAD